MDVGQYVDARRPVPADYLPESLHFLSLFISTHYATKEEGIEALSLNNNELCNYSYI